MSCMVTNMCKQYICNVTYTYNTVGGSQVEWQQCPTLRGSSLSGVVTQSSGLVHTGQTDKTMVFMKRTKVQTLSPRRSHCNYALHMCNGLQKVGDDVGSSP